MNLIRKTAIAVAMLFVAVVLCAEEDSPQERYISKYAHVAVREMYRSGVPASITLAQGLLESGAGQSELAVKGNNHFGIKCHDWTGRKMYYDDDRRGECFRVYSSPDESFRDHSDFLRYRDRYKPLFGNSVTDYKAWAHGLKKAGYATDPSYASKLIKVIEDYRLYRFDAMKPEDFHSESTGKSYGDRKEDDKHTARRERKESKRESSKGDHREGRKYERSDGNRSESIPEPPLQIEEPTKVSGDDPRETISFALKRQLYSNNGVQFVYSVEGETYASIADEYNLFLGEILRFNDAKADTNLTPGTLVYVQAKKSRAVKGLDKYISDVGGETMRDLSQRFGVKLKDLCKRNSFHSDYVTTPGDEINLR